MYDFLGIGAQKGGTTWAWDCLRTHPEVYFPLILGDKKRAPKEWHHYDAVLHPKSIAFWAGPGRENKEKYLSSFNRHDKVQGEITPCYLLRPGVAELIHADNPNVLMFATLRDPTERAISQYKMWKLQGFLVPQISLEEAFFGEHSELVSRGYNPGSKNDLRTRGRYAEQLKRYYNVFSKEQIKIMFNEDIRKDPHGEIKGLFKFLKIDDNVKCPQAGVINHHNGWKKSVHGELDPKVVEKIREYHRPYVKELEELLEKDLSHWK